MSALAASRSALSGDAPLGYLTPTMAYGAEAELASTRRVRASSSASGRLNERASNREM